MSIWWDWKGAIYYELLPQGETINLKYCCQVDKLKGTIATKRPELMNRQGVAFQHDNARLHMSLTVRNKLLSFDWDVLSHRVIIIYFFHSKILFAVKSSGRMVSQRWRKVTEGNAACVIQ